jgi:regulation of enolase protein 1 (concanavalin A-like superfamily)
MGTVRAAPLQLDGVPFPLDWMEAPAAPPRVADGAVEVDAGPRTDLFVPPGGGTPIMNAPRALGRADGDFQLRARISVAFATTFDAGALLLWAGEDAWGKLALEYSPDAEPTVVSVVTRGRSDDCNSFSVDDSSLWLRIARLGDACAFHSSTDGERWQLIRHFAIAGWDPIAVGLLAQSPTGTGCTATFAEVRLATEALADVRSGK